ncbi:MAG TPA: mercuric reductase [Candidatus Saccharimonadales bacterium]|jgi:pyruvate/2-oxoglutarate dehydrogenase complex dihydrolipoamide dehydrogenase (E3) component|nr:mercuric reductase [Candidatus Saccharimonadales bacterium]
MNATSRVAVEPVVVEPEDEFNQKLIENVHPPDWVNPKPSGRYNLVVIGAGTAGLVSAAGAALLGARVALIERHRMGGDCLNYGCVPSKVLIRAARAAYAIDEAREFGIEARIEEINFADTMRRLRRVRADISPHDSARRFQGLGADIYLGDARFLTGNSLSVAGERLEFRKAIIATGARAAIPPVPGLKELGALTNETVFSLTELPKRLIVIGGGPIGCELAQSFARLGSQVSIVERAPRLLPRDDADAATILQSQLEREGVATFLGVEIQRAEAGHEGKTIVFNRGRGEERVSADQILVAAGRTPNLEGLNLEAAGVKFQPAGVIVDDYLRTSNADIYSAGDISSRFQFTHAAEALGRIALQNALFFGRKRASDLVIPWCTYTDPEIAHVGWSTEDAGKRQMEIKTFTLSFADNDRAVVDGDIGGFARVHANKKDGVIVGATLVSRHAGESIGELVMAIQRKLKIGDLGGIIHPYPTQAEIIKRLGDSSMRSRLKPWMKKALVKFFRWSR